jgi:adenylate cyclase
VFSRFVPGDVVEEVLASTDENLRLAGVERDCTVLFSDLRGFTSFSETQPAARVIEVVNYYLNEMTEAILAAGGTLISYMGDGIMALFGAPLDQQDHADRAVVAAQEMIGQRLDRFNAWLAEEGFDRGFEMGVGLNSGPVMAGNVGSEQRVEYTAIGDTTNTASRLEGMTKNSESMLFIADSTRERMHSGHERLSRVGEFEVRGRSAKLLVWTIWPAGAGPGTGSAPDSSSSTSLRLATEATTSAEEDDERG